MWIAQDQLGCQGQRPGSSTVCSQSSTWPNHVTSRGARFRGGTFRDAGPRGRDGSCWRRPFCVWVGGLSSFLLLRASWEGSEGRLSQMAQRAWAALPSHPPPMNGRPVLPHRHIPLGKLSSPVSSDTVLPRRKRNSSDACD